MEAAECGRTVWVELVHNERLRGFLERRGYTRYLHPFTSPCYALAPGEE